jgi:hypothetical protein
MLPRIAVLSARDAVARPMQEDLARNDFYLTENLAARQGCEDRQVHDVEESAEVSEHSRRGAGPRPGYCVALPLEARDDPTLTWVVQRQPWLPLRSSA